MAYGKHGMLVLLRKVSLTPIAWLRTKSEEWEKWKMHLIIKRPWFSFSFVIIDKSFKDYSWTVENKWFMTFKRDWSVISPNNIDTSLRRRVMGISKIINHWLDGPDVPPNCSELRINKWMRVSENNWYYISSLEFLKCSLILTECHC